jgi:hypothetical protein
VLLMLEIRCQGTNEDRRDGSVTTTNKAYQWLSVTQIFFNSCPSHDGDHTTSLFLALRIPLSKLIFLHVSLVFIEMLLDIIIILFCVVLLYVFTFWFPCCDVRYDFRIQTMFGSSVPPVVCRRAHVLFTLFVFVCLVFTSGCL